MFDVGETLIDETREYGTWADWLGVPRHTFSSVFGAVIALGMDYREVFGILGPVSIWAMSGRGEPRLASLSGSEKRICIRMCGRP